MEPQIRHVRFFNGQFLRQDEFNEEQVYGNHMRRRLNYALFEDGVVEITPSDLTIAPVTPGTAADKRIRVLRGMAVGANLNLLEGREIILREDTNPPVDLSTSFAAGDVVWVTVNFRRTEAVPVAVGSSTQNSRVDETAEVRYHAADPAGTLTPDGDPLIVIGRIPFDTMVPNAAGRQIARLRASLFASAASISVNPTTVTANSTVTMTITSTGGYDLSGLVPGMVTFSNNTNLVLPVQVIGTPTPSSAVIRFQIQAAAAAGTRQINVNNGTGTESADFTINAFVPAPTINTATFPGTAIRNNPLVIQGTNFIGTVQVAFPSVATPVTAVVNGAQTQLTVTVPGTATSGTLTVTADGGGVVTPTIVIF